MHTVFADLVDSIFIETTHSLSKKRRPVDKICITHFANNTSAHDNAFEQTHMDNNLTKIETKLWNKFRPPEKLQMLFM